ncbi:MAG: electron transport complex subunit RsxA [Pseudomonadota bacterium]
MTEIVLLLVGAALVNNVVLTRFLGLCPFVGASTQVDGALGMSLAIAFVLTLTAMLSHLVYSLVLVPFDLEYLRTLVFILVIAAAVQLTEITIRNSAPTLHQQLGIYLPLITTNCAVLGVALLAVRDHENLLHAMTFGLGSAAGFGLVLVLFAGLRERIAAGPVPVAFQGPGIALITAGLMALAFMGFRGLARL